MILNPEQQQAVDFRDGQCALIAGPGAGKTKVLTERHSRLVSSGVFPQDILTLTFTREAAEEMRKRSGGSKDSFCTFHSFGYSVVRAEKGEQNLEPEIRHRLLSKLSAKWKQDYKTLASAISRFRRNGISPSQALEHKDEYGYGAVRAYQEYESERLAGGWTDFDSMLADAFSLLQNPEIRAKYQFRFVMCDESQDTEKIQFDILRLITEKYGNILMVGDPNQSVFGFRQAITHFDEHMKQIWPDTQVLHLSTNYRSHGKIVDYIKKKAAHQNPVILNMQAARQDVGPEIEYRSFKNEIDEAQDTIAQAQKSKLTDSIILARTNQTLMQYEKLCQECNIPYRLLGRSGFWKQSEIQKAIKKLGEAKAFPLSMAIQMVMPKIEAHYRVDDMTKEDNDALANLQILKERAREFQTVSEFVAYATRCAHAKPIARGLTLSTIHQAKGTEFNKVFLVSCNPKVMPHHKGDPFEERRIFFVACSRPKDYLRISFVQAPSSFITPELTADLLRNLQSKQNDVEKIKIQ